MDEVRVGVGERSKRTVVAQLREELASFIEDQHMHVGDQLPTEADMVSRFRVARPTLREALKLLEEDGLITVVHGKGRFVSAMADLRVKHPITRFESVTQMVGKFGYRPENRVLSIVEEAANDERAERLQIAVGTPLIRLERLRLQDGAAIVYCVDYFPRSLIDVPLGQIDWSGSLLDILDTFGKRPYMSAATASATMLPDDVISHYQLSDFGPAFLIEETAYAVGGTPVLMAQDYHRGTAFQFSFMRK